MTTVTIVSDSHGNCAFLDQLISQLQTTPPDLVIHLGDNYDDGLYLQKAGFNILQVPGLWTHQYQNPYIDNRIFTQIEGWQCFLTHSPNPERYDLPTDPNPQTVLAAQKINLFLFGHTHTPTLEKQGKVILLNPGHLKSRQDRNQIPTYIQANLTPTQIHLRLISLLTQETIQEKTFDKSTNA
jgi:putative phosphoesterase